ncbi:hypothetical protein Q9R32_03395 [Actinotalea sp. AC32]|nr:hypothetical protein [Actinotalea sp. AC32]
MRAARLARWLVPTTAARYRTALVVGAVSVGLFGYLAQVVGNAATSAATSDAGLGSAALRTIEIGSYGLDQDPRPLTAEAADAIRGLPHVTDVGLWASAQVAPEPDGGVLDAVVLSVSTRYAPIQRPLVEGVEPVGRFDVLLAAGLAEEAGLAVGDELPVMYNERAADGTGEGRRSSLHVVGLYDDEVLGIDDPRSAYASSETVDHFVAAERGSTPEWIAENYVHPRGYVTVDELDSVAPTVQALRDEGFGATSLTTLLTSASSTQQFLAALRPLLGLTVAALLAALAWSTASSVLAARRAEIGVLRATGWRLSEVRTTFTLQLAALGAVVGVGGALLSLALLAVTSVVARDVAVLGVPVAVPWTATSAVWLVGPLVVAVAVFVLAGLPAVHRLARVSPDEVLRDLVR